MDRSERPPWEDRDRCIRAVQSKDARFDGQFFTAVTSTGIYCRPSCPVVPPKPANMRFYPSAAAAQAAGFRACKRCRPDATPGSPEWDLRADVVGRAMRLIADGVVDREGVPGLAARVGYHRRQLERHLRAELGAGPLALARAQRAQTARLLIETTDLPLTHVASAAGFGSTRQFNDTIQTVFALSPTHLRARARKRNGTKPAARPRTATPTGSAPVSAAEIAAPVQPTITSPLPTVATHDRGVPQGTITVKLPFRNPFTPDNVFGHLAHTAIPGVEEWRNGSYRRTLRLPHAPGIVALTPGPDAVTCILSLQDLRDLATAIARCRRLLDLDADPVAVDAALAEDPVLAPLVAAAPGRRVPRTVDEEEMAVRAVLGQQISTAAAQRHAGRLAEAFGEPIDDPAGGLSRVWPTAATLADVDPDCFALPGSRRRALVGVINALADGTVCLAAGADRDAARDQLAALPGIGPWTVEVIALRALGDPDAFPATDLGVRQGAAASGLPTTLAALQARARRWSPWRAYAVAYLTAGHPTNRLPTDDLPKSAP